MPYFRGGSLDPEYIRSSLEYFGIDLTREKSVRKYFSSHIILSRNLDSYYVVVSYICGLHASQDLGYFNETVVLKLSYPCIEVLQNGTVTFAKAGHTENPHGYYLTLIPFEF